MRENQDRAQDAGGRKRRSAISRFAGASAAGTLAAGRVVGAGALAAVAPTDSERRTTIDRFTGASAAVALIVDRHTNS